MTTALLPPNGIEFAEFTKASVAELSVDEISDMSCGELAQAIRAASLPFADEDHLELADRSSLERLTYLARRCCRNQGY